ncbi:MAG: exodeoxyribonuclease VII small subunit [Anaerolineales bacterium]|uniref:Exodeoxyribonuclease 7 small subunit n=1 Tax=Candidatus Desulfolinea nitratireducens TaxID=2841698 RepID=A0A8J6NIJ7_9CHLR|nr:exodeoxyribonuclease VII small subunit [Candidatus Desulfolinea nitratireducens]MBL6959864.1 exodeoxyribonuclease VII small subunit [Anaerolineales bacterium]
MTEKKIEKMSYEEAFAELETIVATLENEQTSLDKSMALFERGQHLSSRCTFLLEEAELKVRQLSEDGLLEADA